MMVSLDPDFGGIEALISKAGAKIAEWSSRSGATNRCPGRRMNATWSRTSTAFANHLPAVRVLECDVRYAITDERHLEQSVGRAFGTPAALRSRTTGGGGSRG